MNGKHFAAVLVIATVTILGSSQAEVVKGAEHARKQVSGTRDNRPTGKGWGVQDNNAPAAKAKPRTTNGINYHGGPLILGTTNVYYIWYGGWSNDPAITILTDLASNIAPSPYYNINTTYFNGSNVKVSNSAKYAGSTSDNYSQGSSLTDAAVQSIVNNAISSKKLPNDPNAVYFVLTSPDVKETSGFCTKYCGWHTHATIAGTDIKYAFVGDPSQQCPSSCEEQTASSPNGDPGADGMASVIAHELEEAVTDPDLNAWYDVRGEENADKCAWTFGTTKTASNGSLYNVTFGSRQYLIQRNWVNASGGYCSMSY